MKKTKMIGLATFLFIVVVTISAYYGYEHDKTYAFVSAVEAAQTRKAIHLLENGLDPNSVVSRLSQFFSMNGSKKGYTLLMHAAYHGNTDVVRELIKRGADVNAQYYNGSQVSVPLTYAVQSKSRDTMELLLDRGALVDFHSNGEGTLLIYAALFGERTAVEVLVSHKANLEAHDQHGMTPLLAAVKWGDPDLIEFLLEHGAKVKAKDDVGETALSLASKTGNHHIIQIINRYIQKQTN